MVLAPPAVVFLSRGYADHQSFVPVRVRPVDILNCRGRNDRCAKAASVRPKELSATRFAPAGNRG
jgi:hypothetical protein